MFARLSRMKVSPFLAMASTMIDFKCLPNLPDLAVTIRLSKWIWLPKIGFSITNLCGSQNGRPETIPGPPGSLQRRPSEAILHQAHSVIPKSQRTHPLCSGFFVGAWDVKRSHVVPS